MFLMFLIPLQLIFNCSDAIVLSTWREMHSFTIFRMTRKNYVNTQAEKKKVYQLKCRLIATFVSHGLDILSYIQSKGSSRNH